MGQLGTAQSARTYSFQSRILPTGYKVTVVVVGDGERQPVPNPLEPVQRTAAVLRTPDGLQCSAVVGISSGDLAA